ncbi:ABC transporter permease [Mesorhizobium tianshanense]|uniref:Peptide/nickel transport system permease protein n=1 Tax=Mesorhizobium tianshanense TaxID=39844 RepID=A0A562MH75_9HYPH|nr:ABC transporter permease [Mesorhizobium tianshanense]TWI19178.1 peptide/nickel transport system permease protein [Mesorhizobium tianshanense]GLS36554.1 ABC transporter permease [Mesorhizobium tianshanense]
MSARFLIVRTLRALLTLILVVTFVFLMLRLAGDPIKMLLPEDTPASVVEQYRARWGMDAPIYVQYIRYVASVLHGDFGMSFRDGRPALQAVTERIPATLTLGFAGLAVALLVGLPAGIAAAVMRNSIVDRSVISFAVVGHSVPTFFFGILLIMLFSMSLRWLPSSGSATWAHLVMPALTIGLWNAATLARFTRASMLDVLSQAYMKTVLANGLPSSWRILRYALPNAAIPIVTMLGLIVGQLLSGAVIVETVFAWPGIGRLTVTAVAGREVAVVQTIVFLSALAMVMANLLVDLIYGWLDPRIGSKTGGMSR